MDIDGIIYIFDSRSRDLNGIPHPLGTSVLLRFNSVLAAERYIINLYLNHYRFDTIYYQIQNFQLMRMGKTQSKHI